MGLFRRKKDADGLYLGDAPVSAPGIDGAAPGAYLAQNTGSTVSAADVDSGAGEVSALDAPAGYQTAYQQPSPPAGQPGGPGALSNGELVDMVSQVFQQAAHQQPGAAPGQQGQFGPRVIPGHGLDPATAARVQAALAKGAKGGSKLGCLFIAIPVIGGLVAAGVGIYAAVTASNSAKDIIAGVTVTVAPGGSAAAPQGSGAGLAEVGKPVTITTDDASYRITVYGAEIQHGDGWGYDGPGAAPALIVGAEIARTDSGQEPVEFTGWNWSVIGDDGNAVLGDIISHFAPSLDGPELAGGESMRGFVSFVTVVTDVELTVAASPFGTPLAAWHLSASTPQVVAGEIGTPAQGEISRPGFTVTVGRPEIVKSDDERVGARPTSGQYIAVPVTFTGIPYMEGSIGNVSDDQLVFIPDGAGDAEVPLVSTFAGLDGANSFFPVSADAPTEGMLAFDTAATKGELQLRGAACQPVVTWQIAPGG